MKLDKPITSEFKSPITISSVASVSQEDLKLAKKAFASISSDHLSKYIPDVNVEKNPDLLPVAFDSCIANLVNANDDAIISTSIVELAKTCKHKYINYEHDRHSVIGHIFNYGFHSFSDKSEISEEEALGTDEPFYMSLGGVVWKIVDKYTSEAIESQSSNNGHGYTVHASWEVSFSEYVLATGSKKIKDATIISDDEEVSKLQKYLRINGGSGYLPDGRPVYRVIVDPSPLFMGIGFTYNPAASVDPIITGEYIEKEEEKEEEDEEESESSNKNLNNISQAKELNVKVINMKLTEINDINEDSIKEAIASKVAVASEIRDFIKNELKKKDDELIQAKLQVEAEKQAALAEKDSVVTELEASKTKVSDLEQSVITLQGELASIRANQEQQERELAFSNRMSEIESEYNLDDAQVKSIVASKIKSIASDEDFQAWKTEFSLLGVGLKKQTKASDSKEDAAEKLLSSASVEGSKIPLGISGGKETKTTSIAKIEVSDKGQVTI